MKKPETPAAEALHWSEERTRAVGPSDLENRLKR